ncbi:MAG: hypothetical protein ACREIT_00230, partial [Tepidisphaeraceae bacterium]
MFSLRNALIAAVAVAAGMFGAANAPAAKVIEIKDPSSGKDSGWRAMVEDGIDLTVFSVANDLTTLSLEKFAHFSNGPTQDGYIEPLRITFFQVSSEATSQIKIADEVVI